MARTLRHEPDGMRFTCAGYAGRDVTLVGYEISKWGEEGPYRVTTGYEVNVVYQGPTYYASYADASEAFDTAVRTLRAAEAARKRDESYLDDCEAREYARLGLR